MAGEDGSGPTDSSMAALQNRTGHVSHSVLMGTINIPDGAEGAMPDLNRIISAVLTSVGLGNGVVGNSGGNNTGSVAAVIPDALTTMSQYLDRLEQGFAANEGITSAAGGNVPSQMPTPRHGNNEIGSNSSLDAGVPSASAVPRSAEPGPAPNDPQDVSSTAGPQALTRRLPTPAALGGLVRRVQSLLNGGAGTALSILAGQLESDPSMADPATRAEVQAVALRDGSMIQQLGALLLELGRTTQTLRMGHSPAESVVNAGPAVFISPMGPNPMMIQPLAYHMGAMPLGAAQLNGGVLGPGPDAMLGPRSIDIHIQTSDPGLASASPSSSPSPSPLQQPASRTLVGITSGAPSLTMRQFFERVEAASGGHDGNVDPGAAVLAPGAEENLSMRQLIERAAEQRAQVDQAAQGGSGGTGGQMQGAIMTFEDNGAVRVHPVRARPSTGPSGVQRTFSGMLHTGTIHARVASENGGVSAHNPFVARLRDHGSQAPQRPPPSGPSTTGAVGTAPQQENVGPGNQDHPAVVSQPTFRAQIHVQGLGGPQPDGISISLGPSSNGEFRVQQVPPQQGPAAGNVIQDAAAPSIVSGDRDVSGGGTHGGVDIVRLIGSVGPFLRHMAEAYSRSGPRQQTELNQPGNSQLNLNSGTADVREASAQPDRSEPRSSLVDCDQRGNDRPSNDTSVGMEVDVESMHEAGCEPKEDIVQQDSSVKELKGDDGGHAAPVGLGLGVLQPLPTRPRRRPHGQRYQHVGNGSSAVAAPTSEGIAQHLVQTRGQLDGSVARLGDQNASDSSLGRLSDLAFLNSGNARRDVPNGTGRGEIDVMGQLMSSPAFNSIFRGNTSNGDNSTVGPPGGIAGIMGQLMRSPLVENIVHQVMESMGDEESQHLEEAMATVARGPGRGGEGGLDLGGMLQQVMPVVSQMLGGRNMHQAPVPSATQETGAQGGDSGRDLAAPDSWKEALSQEEAVSWSETLSADVSRQQSMLPQRPFSDVYARGSPVAKRQKTDLEGAAQKLENGEAPEEVLRSMAENAAALSASHNGSLNGLEVSELAQHVAHADGLADTPILAMAPDSRMQSESSRSRRRSRTQLESDNDWLRLS
eukprot:TRINITY_DN5484_c0_g1_i7.p1 TRINITY_DN5484_c0_g1~~TRINITY_DN5484_c0_g1_i7.p1  ORF type:complete len:1102 (+),score=235.74 TRINITY_DN5484_c0_g1_i7:22-3306(+)